MNRNEEKRHTTVLSHVCPLCAGAGRLRVDALPGDPSFGRSVPCPCSEALLAARCLRQRRRAANLDDLRHCTFSTFNPRLQGVQEAFRVGGSCSWAPAVVGRHTWPHPSRTSAWTAAPRSTLPVLPTCSTSCALLCPRPHATPGCSSGCARWNCSSSM